MTQTQIEIKMLKLEQEVSLLRSFVNGMAFAMQEKEEHYKPAFIRNIQEALLDKPVYRFKNAQTFNLPSLRGSVSERSNLS